MTNNIRLLWAQYPYHMFCAQATSVYHADGLFQTAQVISARFFIYIRCICVAGKKPVVSRILLGYNTMVKRVGDPSARGQQR